MPEREGANIWGYLFKYPRLFRWRIFKSPHFWEDSFGCYIRRWVLCPIHGHSKVNVVDDMGGSSTPYLYCFACQSKVRTPRRFLRKQSLYLYTATYRNVMHNEGLKTEPYKIIACISGEDKDVANHVSPFSILTVGGSIHLTSKVIPWTDLPLYVGMKFTDYGKQLLSTVCSESK